LICITNGHTFNVRPMGNLKDCRDLFKNTSSYVGRMLTVRYQELTALGIPRFPVGLGFRDVSDLPLSHEITSNIKEAGETP